MPNATSRNQFSEYRRKVQQRRSKTQLPDQPTDSRVGDRRHAKARSFGRLFREFLGLLRGHRFAITWALITLSIATLLRLIPPAATKFAIDYVLTDHPLPAAWPDWLPLPTDRVTLLFWLAGVVVVLSIFATAIHLWGRWSATKTVNRVQVSVRKRLFSHTVRLPLHRVYQIKSGEVASLLREDAGGVGELVFSLLYNPWRAIIQLLGSLIVLMWVDWRLMLGGLALVPAVYITHRTWIARIRPLYRDVRAQRQEIDGHATEVFGGIRVVRTFARERSETGRFVRGNDLLVRKQLFVWWWARIVEVTWDMLLPLASTGLLLYGGYRVVQGYLTLGDLMMFLVYLTMLLGPVATLANSATAFQNNLAGLDRVLDVLAEPLEMAPDETARRVRRSETQGRVTLRNVSFKYPGASQLVLRGVDLDARPGEVIALVGRSGAGKTTLCNLVARFYDPTTGVVELDGDDIRTLDVESYRNLFGIVEQDVFLFDGTIRDNITYAKRAASQAQIEQAARTANAHAFIQELDRGYDTLIGERGVRLSGGQRQRLAIARALLADPRILILDEATSNLDSQSERLIQQGLAKLMAGRTCFVIAHRLSTITHADRIVVLDEGQVVEAGGHAELLQRNGQYRRMVDLQTGVEQLM